MPNHFAIQLLCRDTQDREEEGEDSLAKLNGLNLCEAVLPMPEEVKGEEPGANPPWYEFAMREWGTKWGTYETTVTPVPGDNFDLTWVTWISFQTAWGPPHPGVIQRIVEYLFAEFGLIVELAIYFEPYDQTYKLIQGFDQERGL